MSARPLFLVLFAVSVVVFASAAADSSHKLKTTDQRPKGVSEKIGQQLGKTGYQVNGPDGEIGTFWLATGVSVKPSFKPGFMVKYPFQDGQLVGVLQVPENSPITDFRAQEIPAGTYTLRYGQQPMDGNHIGTSELADFLLALPAKADTDPKPITMKDALNEKSANAAGSTHPAIFSMLPDGQAGEAKLTHNADRNYWILEVTMPVKEGEKEAKVPLRLVVVGESEV